jgi:hypothetical protein
MKSSIICTLRQILLGLIKSRREREERVVTRMRNTINTYISFAFPLAKPTRRWDVNIKTDIRETDSVGVDSINLCWDTDQWRALVSTIINPRVP